MMVLMISLMVAGEACLAPALSPTVQTSPATKAFEEANALYAKTENEQALAAYNRAIALDAKRPEFHIGRGRTLARLRRFDEALASYGKAIELAPDGWEGYRHRGHAYINVRKLDLALADLKRATALKKDDWNVQYHLGLAHYLRGEFADAAEAFEACYLLSKDDEEKVSSSAWLFPSLRRAGRDLEARALLDRITPSLAVKTNVAYLDRLLLFKGVRTEEEVAGAMTGDPIGLATAGYGVGLWHLLNNRPERARECFEKVTKGEAWPAFGHVASEIELKRMK